MYLNTIIMSPLFSSPDHRAQILQPERTAHVFQTSDHHCPPPCTWITEPKTEFRALAIEQNYLACLTDDISARCLSFPQRIQCLLCVQTKAHPDPPLKLHCLGIHPSPFSVALSIPSSTEFRPH